MPTETCTREEFDSRVSEKMEQFVPYLNRMSGARRRLLEDALGDYCRAAVQLEDVDEQVRVTGTTIENRLGTVVKNPELTVQHTLRTEKNALLPRLLKYLPDEEEEGGLAEFNGR